MKANNNMKNCAILLFSLMVVNLNASNKEELLIKPERKHTDVILIGALGNLSKKYLWQGFLELYLKYVDNHTTFNFYGCGRSPRNIGEISLKDVLESNIKCINSADELCDLKRRKFIDSVKYWELATENNYINLQKNLAKNIPPSSHVHGKIFYLSIPPRAYVKTAKLLSSNRSTESKKNQWERLVLEKPFGSDKRSAEKLAEDISLSFDEQKIYRVDHYLGKSVVKQILAFRNANREKLEPLLNNHYVARIEVVMKETDGVEDRIDFYDDYGVIRDVMQNHLTELLALITMDLPSHYEDMQEIDNLRMQVLRRVQSVRRKNALIGQYSKYLTEALKEKENITYSKFTPTFGAALLEISTSRWSGVPVLLVSGKQLDERTSFIRLVFSDNKFCVAGCRRENGSHWEGKEQIIFQINQGSLPSPGILVSQELFVPEVPKGMIMMPITTNKITAFGQNLNEFTFMKPEQNQDAYVTLIEDLYLGQRQNFVSYERLLQLWNIWTPLLQNVKNTVPKLYLEKQDRSLNFEISSGGLRFLYEEFFQFSPIPVPPRHASLPASYLGNKVVFGDSFENISQQLASAIRDIMLTLLKTRDIINVAFSGGKTPKLVLKYLSQFQIIWDNVHVWQVDERCVSQEQEESNFFTLYEWLLQHIRIPFVNIHPMPVQIGGRLCNNKDRAESKYEDDIKFFAIHNSNIFDIVLLGIGSDGHTASLFPGGEGIKEHSAYVFMEEVDKIPFKRMTFTYPVINSASHIFVLAMGKEKHEIIMKLMNDSVSYKDFPILGVKPVSGNMTWYFDYDAWLGG